jgi:autotransporter-associated beta strand protein
LTGAHEISASSGAHLITANIAGAAGLVKTGSGTLILPNAKSYTGGTDIQAGTLVLNSLDAIDNQATSALNIASEASTVLVSAGAAGTLAAELTGIGLLNLTGDLEPADTITLNRSNASFNGVIRVDGGTLQVAHSNALGVGGFGFNRSIVNGFESNAKIALSGNIVINDEVLELEARQLGGIDAAHLTSAGNNAWNGNIAGDTGGKRYNIESTSGTLMLAGTISAPDANVRTFAFSGAGITTISGRLAEDAVNVDTGVVTPSANNNVGVVKRGTDTLTIATGTSNPADYWLGPTVVEEGALVVTDPVAADEGELISLDVTVKNRATMNVSAFKLIRSNSDKYCAATEPSAPIPWRSSTTDRWRPEMALGRSVLSTSRATRRSWRLPRRAPRAFGARNIPYLAQAASSGQVLSM